MPPRSQSRTRRLRCGAAASRKFVAEDDVGLRQTRCFSADGCCTKTLGTKEIACNCLQIRVGEKKALSNQCLKKQWRRGEDLNFQSSNAPSMLQKPNLSTRNPLAFTEPSRTQMNGNSPTCPAAGRVGDPAKKERVQDELSPHARSIESSIPSCH